MGQPKEPRERPPTINIGADPGEPSWRARVVRGPRKDGRWYWRAEQGRETHGTRWATVQEAGMWLAEIRFQVYRDTSSAPERWVIGNLLDNWLGEQQRRDELAAGTLSNYTIAAKRLVRPERGLRDVPCAEFCAMDWRRYMAAALREEAPSTVNADRSKLLMAWRWGVEVGGIEAPCPRLPKPRGLGAQKYTPTEAEILAVMDHLTGWRRAVFCLQAGAGARIGEIAWLTWAQVHPTGRQLLLSGKTGQRRVNLPSYAREVLAGLARGEDTASVWASFRVVPATIDRKYGYALRDAQVALGQQRWTSHGLRRAAADRLCREVDPGTAAGILGHSPEVMLRYYRQVNGDDRRRAAEALELRPAGEKVLDFEKK